MPEMLVVGLEAAAAMLALAGSLAVAGYGLTRLLAPPSLRPYAVLLVPTVGAAALIVGSYFLNLVTNMAIATGLLLGGATALGAWLIARRGWWLPRLTRPQWLVVAAATALLVVAFLPHLHGRSPALLGLNIDEDLYVPLAELLKTDTVFMGGAAPGPFQAEFQNDPNHARGWGFPYLLTIASLVSNEPTFHAYVPTLYLLLALSVGAVFVFGRVALGVSERTAALGAALYALNGLPLWFAGMGFGPHVVSFLLFPAAITTGVLAVRDGGSRTIGLAALTSSALLISYFWAISAVYLAVAGGLAVVLVVWRRDRLPRLRNLVLLGLAIGVMAAPGLFWLIRWAAPLLASIAADLNGMFGNAWGDTEFAGAELAFGLAPYRLADEAGPFGELLGSAGQEALRRAREVLFWPALALAALGLVTLRGNRVVAVAMAAAYAGFMFWVAEGASYQYGHFKNLSFVAYFVCMLLASGISNLCHGEFALWGNRASRRLQEVSSRIRPALRGLGLGCTAVLALALVQNTYQTVWWYWSGVGWNVPRSIAHDARAVAEVVPPGSRVFFAHGLTYPLPGERIVLREHVLGFHFPEHQRSAWSARSRSVWMGVLDGRGVWGFADSPAFGYERLDPAERYDFVVLNTSDDARTYGLVAGDAVYRTPYWTVYRVPQTERLTADAMASANHETLAVPADHALRLGLDDGRLALGPDVTPLRDPVLLGVVTPAPATLLVSLGSDTQAVNLEPGLTWLTSASPRGEVLTVRAAPDAPLIQLVAARLLRGTETAELSLEHVNRNIVSIDVRAEATTITGTLIAINLTGSGGNVGLTYQETGTHGFWSSGALVAMPAQRIDFTYAPFTRELRERVNQGPETVSTAREVALLGTYRLEAKMARGFIEDFGAPLLTYSVAADRTLTATTHRQAYVFDLTVGP